MDIKPIKSKRTTEIILEQIKKFLIDGHLKPGDKLPTEMELSEKFQVSRTSIREALSALILTGIVEVRHGEGMFVKISPSNAIIQPLSFIFLMEKNQLQNILEVRKGLEIEAVDLASQRRTEEDLLHLKKLLEEMKNDLPGTTKSEKFDLEFHLTLAKSSKNPLLDRLMNTVQETIGETLKVTRFLWMSANEGTAHRLYEEHKNIYEAVVKGESRRARHLMYEHLSKVEQELKKLKQESQEVQTRENIDWQS